MLVAPLVWAADSKAPPADRQLKAIEKAIEKSRADEARLQKKSESLAEEIGRIQAELVAAARAAHEQEDTLTTLEARLGELRAHDARLSAQLDQRQGQMTQVLMALERLAWRPTEALFAQPQSPSDTVRGALLLRAAVPEIEREASQIRRQLDELAQVRADTARQRERRAAALARLESEKKRLDGLSKRKFELMSRTEEERDEAEKRTQRLAGEAEDLRDLMVRIEEERKARLAEAAQRAAQQAQARAAAKAGKPPPPAPKAKTAPAPSGPAPYDGPARPFTQARGSLPMPARGPVISQYGDPNDFGGTWKGIRIETRPGAQVIAPYDGMIVFSGPFRGYGLLLIIEHGEGYHTLLAGARRIEGAVGQTVLAGEPIALMAEAEAKPVLYVELRRNGHPVNPMPWLAAQKDKVAG
ncbi:MAG: peptidoglycan DD-metalloendopeptidase family protein [Rhodospirillales bacterium]|nr:peptidoglycan DD-metalloendopeptidase family protein [Rhodospirillales bacterium]